MAARPADGVTLMRNLIGTSTIFPAAAEGSPSARSGGTGGRASTSSCAAGPTCCSSRAVSVNVEGEDNLHAQRPAVFIFNHKNLFDIFVAARIVRYKFTSVGKKEAGRIRSGLGSGS